MTPQDIENLTDRDDISTMQKALSARLQGFTMHACPWHHKTRKYAIWAAVFDRDTDKKPKSKKKVAPKACSGGGLHICGYCKRKEISGAKLNPRVVNINFCKDYLTNGLPL